MDLLFAHADDGTPFVETAPDARSAAGEVQPIAAEKYLADITAHADDLERQRWALVVPEGPTGDRLAALVRPLRDKRADDQAAPVRTIRVPPGLDAAGALAWKQRVYPEHYERDEKQRPRYLLILGDMDGVSLATQQALALDGFPGRLVCPNEDGYQAYVHKVLTWERTPSVHDRARTLFYTVHDGTAATRAGYEGLVKPCFDLCAREHSKEPRRFAASTVLDQGSRHHPDAGELLDLVAERYPSILFSLSHGMGPPRRRSWSPAEARELQGAMHFGAEEPLVPSEVIEGSFLPGGVWFYTACFGAGTPSESAYHHWLLMLEGHGARGLGHLQDVLRGLSATGGFTSGLAQAALANPDGPLAVIGHVDLAWSYGYEELRVDDDAHVRGVNQVQSYFQFIRHLLWRDRKVDARGRVGAAMLELQLPLGRVNTELNNRYDACKRQGIAPEGASDAARLALGHLWMLRQDLLGYVLLGDPAVYLPVATETRRSDRSRRAGFLAGLGGRTRRTGDDKTSDTRDADIDDPRMARMETAVLALATGTRTAAEVGEAFGGTARDAERWKRAYCEAGRRALAEVLQNDERE